MRTLLPTSLFFGVIVYGALVGHFAPAPGVGPNPQLPPPTHTLIPTVETAPAIGWGTGETPIAAPGTKVAAFATNLDHPRWLYVLPNGDVLVAETNGPERIGNSKGLKAKIMAMKMKKTGGAAPTANRITLLRDTDGDGIAETRSPFLENLYSPFGMALVGDQFYVANSDAIVAFPYIKGQSHIGKEGTTIIDLPAGPLNHHWTKSLIASPDGSKLYVGVGSNSNVAENGIGAEEGRAAIWEVDPRAKTKRFFAMGLRNPVGLAWESKTLWVVVNERDELGNDLVPDYLTSVRDGAFYGWPYSYFGQHVDTRVKPERPDLVAKAVVPDYALGAHVAALGLTISKKNSLPEEFQSGAFIGEHGSWNRKPKAGYKVVFVPFNGGKPSGTPIDVLTGFISPEGDAHGRPVGVALDKSGALLVADDVGNTIWRVTKN